MGWFKRRKRQAANPPAAVLEAACQVYDLSPDRICTFHAEQVEALSDNMWVVTLYTQSQAIVAYTPGEEEKAVAAPWEDEPALVY
jgi:hypothetical protein